VVKGQLVFFLGAFLLLRCLAGWAAVGDLIDGGYVQAAGSADADQEAGRRDPLADVGVQFGQ